MKAIWQGRVNQAAAKVGDNAPMVGVCCNACRTCMQTNILTLGLAAVLGVGAGVAHFAKRLVKSS